MVKCWQHHASYSWWVSSSISTLYCPSTDCTAAFRQQWRDWHMYIGSCTGHSCRNGSTAVQGSQARRTCTTYRWCTAPTQESAGPPNLHSQLGERGLLLWYNWLRTWLTQHRDRLHHSPTEQSSMEGKLPPLTLNFLLSSGVSCASMPSTTCWSYLHGSSWNSAMLLFLATPLTAATPNFCTSVWGTASHCRSKEWTVQYRMTYAMAATVHYIVTVRQIMQQ